ncbi:MAG: helix-turn-helix domain-containing protein [Acidovorax sp.]|nr:helix-turn-helix domain-containing protein [Acidovorax sp.]
MGQLRHAGACQHQLTHAAGRTGPLVPAPRSAGGRHCAAPQHHRRHRHPGHHRGPRPGALREFCLVSVLRNAHGLACWMVDSRIPLIAAEFAFDAPPHADAYDVLFRGPATFHAPRTALHFDARYLHLPLRRDEQALRQMLQHALPLTVLQYRRDRLLVQRVRQLLAAPLPGQPAHALPQHSAESLAALLHVSPRTLHRQLKEEGATLQGLKDDVRRTRAVELLHRTQRPIKQVAEAAGFENEKSFIRAFRGWTGQSPAEFRRVTLGL